MFKQSWQISKLRRLTRHQAGVTLVEILVTLVLSAFLVIGMVAFLMHMTRHQTALTRYLDAQRTGQNIAFTLQQKLISNGYAGNAEEEIDHSNFDNPFHEALTVEDNCLLFAYDVNEDGQLPDVGHEPSDERFGFVLKNGIMYQRPESDSTFNCQDIDNWHKMNNVHNVEVKTFDPVLDEHTVESNDVTFTRQLLTINLATQIPGDESAQFETQLVVPIENTKVSNNATT